MRRSTFLGAATAAALAAGSLAVTIGAGLEPPRGAETLARPDRRRHRRLRLHGEGRARQPDGRRQLDPVRGSRRRAELLQASTPRPATTSTSTTPATARYGRPLPFTVQRRRSATRTRSWTRSPPVDSFDDPKLNVVQTYDAHARDLRGTASCTAREGRRDDLPVAPEQHRARRRCPNYARRRAAGASAACPAAARCSPASATIRSSSTSARPSTPQHRKPGRRRGPATRAAARTTSRATTSTRSCCRCRSREVTRNGKAVSGPSAAQRRRRRVGERPSGRAAPGHGPAQAPQGRGRKWVQVSRLGNPLINEVVIPLGPEGQVQPHPAGRRRRRTSARSCVKPELAQLINVLFGLGVKETNRTDIVQALLTGIPGLTQIGTQAGRGRHAEDQPRRAADRHAEPLRRARRRQRRVPERPPPGDDVVDIELRVRRRAS